MNKPLIITLILAIILPLIKGNIILIEQTITENFTSINNVSIAMKESPLTIILNREIKNLDVSNKNISCDIFNKNSIICNSQELPISFSITFETEEIIKDNIYELSIVTKAEKLYLTIYLPVGYVVKEENVAENPKFLSDGKRIILFFSKNNATTFSTKFSIEKVKEEKIITYPYSLIIIILVVISIALIIIYLYYKGKLEKQRKSIIEVLEPNERKVLEILMQNNPITQKKIVELTQLSKAEVSKIISSLKQRGIVDVEKRGRNNIIYLKKKI
ncbi:MAG: winged helix-turn-helix transcriptional regulator [Candidatus Aenigmatarchaeota archaeon]